MSKQLMMTNDLSMIPTVVARAVMENYGHHRSPWFQDILQFITTYFKNIFGEDYEPLFLTNTISGAYEAIVSNTVCESTKVLVNKNSVFEKYIKICGGESIFFDQSDDNYGINNNLKPTCVFLEHVSTDGQLLGIEKIITSIRKIYPGIFIAVDISSSLGADQAEFKDIDVDAYIASPEKSLMGIPGVTMVIIKKTAFKKLENFRVNLANRPYLLDLLKTFNTWETKKTTPYSPNISAMVALEASLKFIDQQGGLVEHVKRHQRWAEFIRIYLTQNNFEIISQDNRPMTNAFTIFKMPPGLSTQRFVNNLEENNIFVKLISGIDDVLCLGHLGYVTKQTLAKFIEQCSKILSKSDSILLDKESYIFDEQKLDQTGDKLHDDVFSLPATEFQAKVVEVANKTEEVVAKKIIHGSKFIFRSNYDLLNYPFKKRTIGFIGAGNTVRWAVEYCQKIGFINLMVYSPSLAAAKIKPSSGEPNEIEHKNLDYWQKRGIKIADSAEEIFMNSHTVVLLPILYNTKSLEIFDKPSVYLNEHIINKNILDKIQKQGKMDVLINASARAGLIDRASLAQALKKGWLKYYSDELPDAHDPLLDDENAIFTGHVGGSCTSTQKIVSKNTNKILQALIQRVVQGNESSVIDGYPINIVNKHLKPKNWRLDFLATQSFLELRVLITDKFDLDTINFPSLEKIGIKIVVRDISKQYPDLELLRKQLLDFRPHIMMIRSRTKISKELIKITRDIPEFSVILRPGVGVDNVYDGMLEASKLGIQIINEPLGNSYAVGQMTVHFIINSVEDKLLTPGPTRFNPRVFEVMDSYKHHHSAEFRKDIFNLSKNIGEWMHSHNPALILSIPSTGFMEAAISNLTADNERGLVVSHGKFGNRFAEICKTKNRSYSIMAVEDKEWGKVFSPSEIKLFLNNDKKNNTDKNLISFLCLQQNETSSGVAYKYEHLQSIVASARAYNPDMIIIVDAVSGFLASDIDFDRLDIDVMIVGSQKALAVSSGLSFLGLSDRAIRRLLQLAEYGKSIEEFLSEDSVDKYFGIFERKQKVYYLDLLRLYFDTKKYKLDDVQSIFHVYSTIQSLGLMENMGGPQSVIKNHIKLAEYARKYFVQKFHFSLMSQAPYFSNSVTPVLLADNMNANQLRADLKDYYGITVAGSQSDYWKKNMIRLGHFGYINQRDLDHFFRALKIVWQQNKL